MATLFAASTNVPASLCSAEEALLDAYDLQWKAIDIRLEKLRNECERMLLEYEVQLKQETFVRECEDLMRQKQAQHERATAEIHRELREKLAAVEDETRQRQRIDAQTVQKPTESNLDGGTSKKKQEEEKKEEEPVEKPTSKRKPATAATKPAAKRKLKEVALDEQEEEEKEEDAAETKQIEKAKPNKKAAAKSAKAAKRPLSPPVYSPEDDEPTVEETGEEEEPVAEPDLSNVADDDLLDMLTQDQGSESEDFGDASAMSLIHPESPAMLSPKRLKKKLAFDAARLAKADSSSPLRGGEATLASRLMHRIKAVSKQPLGEPEPPSDASLSPPLMLATPQPKRALKRRKTVLMSPVASQEEAVVAKATVVVKKATASQEAKEKQSLGTAMGEEVTKPQEKKKKTMKTLIMRKQDEASSDDSTVQEEATSDEVDEPTKNVVSKKKKKTEMTKKTKKAAKEEEVDREDASAADQELPARVANHSGQEAVDNLDKAQTKKQNKMQVGAVTGRSKARQTAKMAALRAAAGEESTQVTGFSAIHDIQTPKVPRKKMGVDGKKKQSNDLAAKRAEFQQTLNEAAHDQADEASTTNSVGGKKRRRKDETVAGKEQAELEFHTPKPKSKKAKIVQNPFPNDELNIMKSPMPLLRAKIAEKKQKEQDQATKQKKSKKRSVSERGEKDEEDPGYGSPAVNAPESSVLPSRDLAAQISTKPGSSGSSNRKGPEEMAAAASDYAARWLNSGLVTRAKKNAVKTVRKPATKPASKPAAMWGGGASFFDAFVNTGAPAIPRLKSSSAAPKI